MGLGLLFGFLVRALACPGTFATDSANSIFNTLLYAVQCLLSDACQICDTIHTCESVVCGKVRVTAFLFMLSITASMMFIIAVQYMLSDGATSTIQENV